MNAFKFPSSDGTVRIARMPEASLILGLSPSTIRNRIKEGGPWYDPNFPKPIRLGTGRRCAIGWRVDELLTYFEMQRHPMMVMHSQLSKLGINSDLP